jgi:hypothetical protein
VKRTFGEWVPVEIIWEDAHGGGDQWTSPRQIELAAHRVVTVGQVIADTDEGIAVGLSHDLGADGGKP